MDGKIFIKHYLAPCGELLLGSLGDRLCLCNWAVEKHPGRVDRRLTTGLRAEYQEGPTDITQEAARQLDQYFSGERKEFDIPLLLVGTDFQKRSMAAVAVHTFQPNLHLCGIGCTPWHGQRCSRRSQCQRRKRHIHIRAMPPRYREQQHTDGLRRRHRGKKTTA